MVKSLWVTRPTFLNPQVLPNSIRSQYVDNYKNLIQEYKLEGNHLIDYNESDLNQLSRIILSQIDQCLNMLSQDQLPDSDQHLKDMVAWCQKWDRVYGYDARELYPELTEILDQYGYNASC
jgi:predicted esterase YcpF (UPF0227 family)